MPEPIRVVVACDDAAFVRLAAVALSRSGQTVRTVQLGATRLTRLIAEGTTDVVVVDSDKAADEVRAAAAAGSLAVGIVRVRDEGELGVTKWGPLAALAAEVQIAAEEARADTRAPRLRIVS